MTKKTLYILFLLCVSFWALPINAQTVEQLKKERREIQKKLEQTNRQLRETQKNEKQSLKKINIIQQGVQERKALINNYNTEINVLDNKIDKLSGEKAVLEKDLERLKKDYTRLIQKAQTNRNVYSKIMFIFSAENFDQSMRRLRYLGEYTAYEKQQGNRIKDIQKQLTQKTDSLGSHKNSKVEAVKAKQVETAKLQRDQKNETLVLTDLQKKEKNLSAEYQKHRQKVNEINAKIERIIAEEIRKAEERRKAEARRKAEEAKKREAERVRKAEQERKAALVAARRAAEKARQEAQAAGKSKKEIAEVEKKSTAEIAKIENQKIEAKPQVTEDYSALTREESLLSGNFERNRGRLPWPVDRGAVSGRFGIQPHPVLRHVTINNKGTYFQSPAGTNARAVYDGVVKSIFSIPGGGNAVIVQHGNYRTVYGGLSSIYVHNDQKISSKQPLGKIYSDDENGKTELYFQIYNGKSVVNPEGWIAR